MAEYEIISKEIRKRICEDLPLEEVENLELELPQGDELKRLQQEFREYAKLNQTENAEE